MTTHVWNYSRNLRLYERKVLGERKVSGVRLLISGIRLPANEYVILVSAVVTSQESLNLCWRRWQIETLFDKLKSHGFDLEDSRLQGKGKADKLLAASALASAW